MSKQVSHNISVALGLRLGFYAGAGLTYNVADPDVDKHKPVRITDDRTVVLAAVDTIPTGSLILVEPDDGMGVKATVELGPICRFRRGANTFAAADFGKGVLADGTGAVKPVGAVTTGSFGKVTSVEGDYVYVLTY